MRLETEADLIREGEARLLLSKLSGLDIRKREQDFDQEKKGYAKIDWIVSVPQRTHQFYTYDICPIAWAEFKGYNKSFAHVEKTGGFLLSFKKWVSLKIAAYASDLPFWLVYGIKTPERKEALYIGKFLAQTQADKLHVGGRTDRGLSSDQDLMITNKLDRFVPVNTQEEWELAKPKLTGTL